MRLKIVTDDNESLEYELDDSGYLLGGTPLGDELTERSSGLAIGAFEFRYGFSMDDLERTRKDGDDG